MSRWRRALSVVRSGLLVVGILAFAQPVQGATTIQWMAGVWNPMRQKLVDRLIEVFQKENPGVQVKWTQWNRDQLLVRYVAGEGPDVVAGLFAGDDGFWQWLPQGMIYDFSDRIQKELDLADFFPGTIQASLYNGKLYSFDNRLSAQFLFVNKDMYEGAGLVDPYTLYKGGSWNWDKFITTSEKITKDTNGDGRIEQWAIQAHNGLGFSTLAWIYSGGGRLVSPDGRKSLLSSPATISSLQFLQDWVTRYKFATLNLPDIPWKTFQQGLLGIYSSGAWDLGIFSSADLNWDVAPIPAGPGGLKSVFVRAGGFYALSTTKHPEEAWKLIKFLYGKEAQELMVQYGEPPGRISVARSDLYLKQYPKAHLEATIDAQMVAEPSLDNLPYWPQYLGQLNSLMNQLAAGQKSAAQLVAAADPVLQKLIDDTWARQKK